MDHIAYRRRAGDGAVFTSSKCPSGAGLKNTCELPFGFVWTPMSPSTTTLVLPDDKSLPPVLCLNCLSYLNLYSSVDESSGMWTCPFCETQNVMPPELFGTKTTLSPIMISPIVEYRQTLPNGTDHHNDPPLLIIILDSNLAKKDAHAVAKWMESFVKEETAREKSFRLGLIAFDKTVSVYQLGMSGIASADIIVPLGDNEDEDEEIIVQRQAKMPERMYTADVSTAADLASFQLCIMAAFGILGEEDIQQHRTSKQESTKSESWKQKLRRKKEARRARVGQQIVNETKPESPFLRKNVISSAPRCTGEAIHCAIDLALFSQETQSRATRIMLFTNGCPNMGDGNIVRFDERLNNKVAPDIVDPISMTGAVQYFELTGKEASEQGIAIDVFCAGAGSLGLQAYQALVDPSGGYALPLETFHCPQFVSNADLIAKYTHLSMSDKFAPDNHLAFLTNRLDGCTIDLRMSSFITPTHVVGAAKIQDEQDDGNTTATILPNEREAFAAGASLAAKRKIPTNELPSEDQIELTLTRIKMGRYDPLSTLSVMLDVDDSIEVYNRYGIFQCTARYLDVDQKTLVTRVCTQRLPVAKNVQDFLDGMDEEAVPVVLGREAVFRSCVGREEQDAIDAIVADTDRMEDLAIEAQKDLDNTIHRISSAFRLMNLETKPTRENLVEEGGLAGANSSLDFAFPPELADALHRLFHLRRGSMLSPGPVRSLDDRAELRNLFLRLPLDDCLCMMAPSLWSSKVNGVSTGNLTGLEPVPSDTLALWDNRIIAADHHDALFVWSGCATSGISYDRIRAECKQFLLERSRDRFPAPKLHILSEGDSMSRRFTARLAPSHADPVEQQIVHFPALGTLTQAEMVRLRNKFKFYDAKTDASFRRWFWTVVSARSNARNEGMTLCE